MGLQQVQGKVAVVTGASAGIGAAVAQALVRNGMIVVGAARRAEKVQELGKQLEGQSGKLHAKKCDISKQEDVEELFRWVKEQFGTIHVLVNNAGVSRYGRLYDQNPKYWHEIVNTNVLGTAVCTQQALQLMKISGVDDGHIIHINSIQGHHVIHMPNPLTGMYSPSKFAITAMTEILRQELRSLGSKIRVTSISPGIVKTEIGDAANAALDEQDRIDRSALTGTFRPELESDDVAEAVLYVLGTRPRVQIHEIIIKPVGELV